MLDVTRLWTLAMVRARRTVRVQFAALDNGEAEAAMIILQSRVKIGRRHHAAHDAAMGQEICAHFYSPPIVITLPLVIPSPQLVTPCLMRGDGFSGPK